MKKKIAKKTRKIEKIKSSAKKTKTKKKIPQKKAIKKKDKKNKFRIDYPLVGKDLDVEKETDIDIW